MEERTQQDTEHTVISQAHFFLVFTLPPACTDLAGAEESLVPAPIGINEVASVELTGRKILQFFFFRTKKK